MFIFKNCRKSIQIVLVSPTSLACLACNAAEKVDDNTKPDVKFATESTCKSECCNDYAFEASDAYRRLGDLGEPNQNPSPADLDKERIVKELVARAQKKLGECLSNCPDTAAERSNLPDSARPFNDSPPLLTREETRIKCIKDNNPKNLGKEAR